MQHTNNKKWISYLMAVGLGCWSLVVTAQQNPVFTQYFNSPLWMNPAYAGARNSLAIDFATRQQWIGVEGAPMTYYMGAHTPVNDTKMSFGASLMSDIAGPVMANHFSLSYAYLLRINHNNLLSVGVNAGLNNHWVHLNKLDLNDPTDPNFQNNIENGITPSFGTGFVLYSPLYFLSFSMPSILPDNVQYSGESNLEYRRNSRYFLSAGFNLPIASDHLLRLSGIARLEENVENAYDIAALYNYIGYFSAGASYRLNQSAALILGVQINENIGLTYSYDFPIGTKSLNLINFQELTLSIDLFQYFEPNLDREFRSKKGATDDGKTRSIRYF
ncbi:MAG: type IX secretion system membrane protein PorP/SprF [Bacteroidales bacterium]|nr:type IX secretion system membrane protein PorP/SprF [Bacteroidales bacterium]